MRKKNTERGANNTNLDAIGWRSARTQDDNPSFKIPISMHSNFDGYAFDVGNMLGVCVSAIVDDHKLGASDPTGTLYLQASNDPFDTTLPSGTSEFSVDPDSWVDIADSEKSVAGNEEHMWNIRDIFYKWIRARYERTSGDGTVYIRYSAKGPS